MRILCFLCWLTWLDFRGWRNLSSWGFFRFGIRVWGYCPSIGSLYVLSVSVFKRFNVSRSRKKKLDINILGILCFLCWLTWLDYRGWKSLSTWVFLFMGWEFLDIILKDKSIRVCPVSFFKRINVSRSRKKKLEGNICRILRFLFWLTWLKSQSFSGLLLTDLKFKDNNLIEHVLCGLYYLYLCWLPVALKVKKTESKAFLDVPLR